MSYNVYRVPWAVGRGPFVGLPLCDMSVLITAAMYVTVFWHVTVYQNARCNISDEDTLEMYCNFSCSGDHIGSKFTKTEFVRLFSM